MMRLVSISICCLLTAAATARGAGPLPASRGYVLVTNVLDKSLSIVDPIAEKEIARVPVTGIDPDEVEAFPRQVAVSPDGRTAWVPIYSDTEVGGEGTSGRSITIVSLTERKVAGYVDLGKPMRPYMPAFGPKDGLLYVTTELDNSITVIDPNTRKVVGSLPTGEAQSHGLIFSKDGMRIYTWNVAPGSISVIDVAAKKTVAKISLGGQVQRLALSRDDSTLYASDQTQPRIIVIDTKAGKITGYIRTPTVSYALSMSPDGGTLLAALPFRGMLGAIDPANSERVRTFSVLRNPQSLVFSPDGREAYVSTGSCNALGIIDVKEWKVRKYVKVSLEADGIAWAPEAR
jgi:YVTN family beta-propeller protein